jgi:hypothetical protein
MIRHILLPLLLAASAAAPAAAQVINPEDRANRPPVGEVSLFGGVEMRQESLTLQMLSADARPAGGTGGAQAPFNHSQGNRGVDFDINHRLLGVRAGVMTGLSDSVFTSISLTLGAMETTLRQESDANTYAPQGRISARLDPGFALRLDLSAWLQEPDQKFFLRARYRYGASWTEFDDDFFLSSNVDGVYTESSHRISVYAGYDTGPFKPFIGVGTIWYRGGGTFKESDFARGTNKNQWTVVWRQDVPFTLELGVDLPAMQGAYARVDLALVGEFSWGFSLGGRF